MGLSELEYSALRHTIGSRGTARIVLLPVTFIAWALVALLARRTVGDPLAAMLPLLVLAAGFEAIHALHVGVERIGRYLQVYYESGADAPRWETAAMAAGPALPGGGIDPLFSVLFVGAAALNLLPSLPSRPSLPTLTTLGVLHLALVYRVLRARQAAAAQRAVELESFRAVQVGDTNRRTEDPAPTR